MFYPQMCESLFEKIRLYICLEGGKLTPKAPNIVAQGSKCVVFFCCKSRDTFTEESLVADSQYRNWSFFHSWGFHE